MFDFARTLTLPSLAPFLRWRAGGRTGSVVLRSRSGPRFELRPTRFGGLGNSDYGVAYEIFVHDFYRLPEGFDPSGVRLVVDLGTNVGFSVLHWLYAFPECRVITFEPHPGHGPQALRNFALNGMTDRVEFHPVGAGTAPQRAVLSDVGPGSTVRADGEGIVIEIADVFPVLEGRRIDLLKLDIEGGEYEIMADPRFAGLDVRAIVMEWHAREGYGREWCISRLRELGYRVRETWDEGEAGMLWALRQDGAPPCGDP